MNSKINWRKIIILFVFFFISIFYFFHIINNKGYIKIEENVRNNENSEKPNSIDGITKFLDVEYKIKSKDKEYTTKGKTAFISKNEPNIINIEIVNSFTILNDGSVLNVNSDRAKYIKNSKNIEYYQNVIITNNNKIITAQKAIFLSNKNLIELQDMIYRDNKSLLKGDFAQLNTATNNLKILMNNNKDQVYGKKRQ